MFSTNRSVYSGLQLLHTMCKTKFVSLSYRSLYKLKFWSCNIAFNFIFIVLILDIFDYYYYFSIGIYGRT